MAREEQEQPNIEIVQESPRPFWKPQERKFFHNVDFVGIFHRRLAAIQPLSGAKAVEAAWGYRDLGIERMIKKGVAAAFQVGSDDDSQIELWLEDPKDISDERFPHGAVKEEAAKFTKANNIPTVAPGPLLCTSAEIIQDEQNRLLLCLPAYAEDLQKITENVSANSNVETDNWLDLIQRYELQGIVGPIGYSTQWIIDIDLLGKLRRDRYILELARRHQLTNTQLCRFQALTTSAEAAEMTTNYEKLAEEIAHKDNT